MTRRTERSSGLSCCRNNLFSRSKSVMRAYHDASTSSDSTVSVGPLMPPFDGQDVSVRQRCCLDGKPEQQESSHRARYESWRREGFFLHRGRSDRTLEGDPPFPISDDPRGPILKHSSATPASYYQSRRPPTTRLTRTSQGCTNLRSRLVTSSHGDVPSPAITAAQS
jgi:hypothetical protein